MYILQKNLNYQISNNNHNGWLLTLTIMKRKMKKVIFCTNLPSPYRVDFFNELGKYCKLIVLYERQTSSERHSAWKGEKAVNFEEIYLRLQPVGVDRSKGSALRKYIIKHKADMLVFTNYVSPATIDAIIWCRLHGCPYYVEYDGGFNKKDLFTKRVLKKILLKGAIGHITTAEEHIKYLKSLGISDSKIYKYPFSSIKEQDIVDANVLNSKGRSFFKKKLGIKEEKIILTDLRFYDNITYDILLSIARNIKTSVGIYIIGKKPLQMSDYSNIHFVSFGEDDISIYYAASDIFMALSNKRIEDYDLNTALIYGLPIIISDSAVTSSKLIDNGDNAYIVNLKRFDIIKNRIIELISNSTQQYKFGKRSFLKILKYSSGSVLDKSKNILWEENRKRIKEYSKYVLGIHYDKMIIAVGQFIHRKGFDILMKAAANFFDNIGVYIVGGEPNDEYLQLQKNLALENVHFVGFKTKHELSLYYQAADCTAFPTREDIWGLITNESMAHGVPVVATQRCVSALEMVDDYINGFIIPVDDSTELYKKIIDALSLKVYKKTLDTAMRFTIQSMVEAHINIINNVKKE